MEPKSKEPKGSLLKEKAADAEDNRAWGNNARPGKIKESGRVERGLLGARHDRRLLPPSRRLTGRGELIDKRYGKNGSAKEEEPVLEALIA